jgi:hypothetical protein
MLLFLAFAVWILLYNHPEQVSHAQKCSSNSGLNNLRIGTNSDFGLYNASEK